MQTTFIFLCNYGPLAGASMHVTIQYREHENSLLHFNYDIHSK